MPKKSTDSSQTEDTKHELGKRQALKDAFEVRDADKQKPNTSLVDEILGVTSKRDPAAVKRQALMGALELLDSGHTRSDITLVENITESDKVVNPSKHIESSFTLPWISSSVEQSSDRLEDKRPEYLAALLATVPQADGYAAQAQSLDELNQGFRREMAARLQPLLNAHIQTMPQDTYEEKKAISRLVNEELRRFDLAIKCPKTGKPGLLVGDPGNHPEIGRFCIEIKAEDGKRKRTVNSPELPHLDLMEAAPRREALSEWHDKVGRTRGGAQRS